MNRATIRRLEVLAPWAAGLLLAAPVLLFRYPPMGDLPMHEALVAILRHRGEPAWGHGLYRFVVPQANQLFHYLALVLSYAVPTDTACKVVVAASLLASVVAMARLLGVLGRSHWLALLVAPLVCGWMFRWGLVANLLGFAALLAALPSLEALARRPSDARAGIALAWTLVVFLAHESSAVILGLVSGYFALVRGSSVRGAASRAMPAVLVGALVVAQSMRSAGLEGPTMRAVGTDLGPEPWERLAILPGAVFGGVDAARLAALGAVSLAALAASALGRKRTHRAVPLRAALWHHRYAVLGGVFFLFYVVFPMSMAGTTLLAHRFLAGAWLGLVVACASRRTTLVRAALASLVPLAVLASEVGAFRDTDRRYRDLDVILARIPEGVAVAQLDLAPPRAPGHVAPVPPAASRVLAEHGGRMLFAMTDMPPNPVYLRPEVRWDEPLLRLVRTPFAFMPAHDARRFAYLVTSNGSPAFRREVEKALAPDEELVVSSGTWDLFRSTLPLEPIDAADAPLPDPPPETLEDRLRHAGAIR